ncbi:hypothetical protein RI129_009235 [Pyrocoelia pectoralis]|uniref:Serine/threonine-protein kinase ATM n=1 Tax=Pyrocoelia pectoralis TaxID=417401 RepID=A0AAN7ZIT7_9COLE
MATKDEELRQCCRGLLSNKILERKRNFELLLSLLETQSANLELSTITWNDLTKTVHLFLQKEAAKLEEDEHKKKTPSYYNSTNYGVLFINVVKTAKLKETNFKIVTILQCILEFFKSPILAKHYNTSYLIVLRDEVLSSDYGQIESQEWIELLSCIKHQLEISLPYMDEIKLLQSLNLLLKWGPLHSLPTTHLRQQFSFMSELCRRLDDTSSKGQQEVIICILIEFMTHTAEDNRMACCKLGENIFSSLIEIYQSQTVKFNIKVLILKLFLFQIKIHHPKGALDGNALSYACCWSGWHQYLRTLYSILCQEISNIEQIKFKSISISSNQSHYIPANKTFVTLFVEVFYQLVINDRKMNTTLHSSEGNQPPGKRSKIEVGAASVIRNIQDTKDWCWIHLMTEILKEYPKVITQDEFVWLLEILSSIQSECKCSNLCFHVYESLTVLVGVESYIGISNCDKVELLWTVVADCTLRAVGLNQSEQQTHKLLQRFMEAGKTVNTGQLFRTYTSKVLNLSIYSTTTLYHACEQYGISSRKINGSGNDREILINWILKVDLDKNNNTTYIFSESVVAKILLFLTFKQWPNQMENVALIDKDKFITLEKLYRITFFSCLLDINDKRTSTVNVLSKFNKTYVVCEEMFDYLEKTLIQFLNQFCNANTKLFPKALDLLNAIILYMNVLSLMIECKIVDEYSLQEKGLLRVLEDTFKSWIEIVQPVFHILNAKKNIDRMEEILKQLKKLFDIHVNCLLTSKLRTWITTEFIQNIFMLLNKTANGNPEDEQSSNSLNMLGIDVLCSFCNVPRHSNSDVQHQILYALSEPNFDARLKTDYEQTMRFLKNMENLHCGVFSVVILEKILQSIQIICEVHYTKHDTALNIIQILHGLIPHIAQLNSNSLGSNLMTILDVFFKYRNNYGPLVSESLLNCIGTLVEFDPDANWCKRPSNEEVIFLIMPDFLISDYQKIRIAAIQQLMVIFRQRPKTKFQKDQQKCIFERICKMSYEVFNVKGTVTEERKIDESVTRTASVLHTFVGVISVNATFGRHALFTLIQLVNEKHLNTDSSLQVLDMVAKHRNMSNAQFLLDSNLDYLISEWRSHNLAVNQFPYVLFGCNSLKLFYFKYIHIMVPVLLEDLSLFDEVCADYHISKVDILKECFSRVVGKYIINISTNDNRNKCYNNFAEILTVTTVHKLMFEKLDEVIVYLLRIYFDPERIDNISVSWSLPEPSIPCCNTHIINVCFDHIANVYLNGCSPLTYCLQGNGRKSQKILLSLISKIYESHSVEEKMVALHQFSFFIDALIPHLKQSANINTYLIRTISYTLIHLIESKNNLDVNICCCKYLYAFICSILPENSEILEKCLIAFVAILMPISKMDNDLGNECVKLLHCLIVDHTNLFKSTIKLLDPFPTDFKYSRINSVYGDIKYNGSVFKLEDEIENFIVTGTLMGDAGNRTEGLRYLKKRLSNQKEELKHMYNNLRHVRGFSEDCQKSVLHQLVCALVKLSLSSDTEESLEATKCLGELGSSSLLSVVLQIEQSYENEKCIGFELVTRLITKILSNYIVDKSFDVMEVANSTLLYVLDCKEGKSIFSDSDFKEHFEVYLTPFISSPTIKSNSDYSFNSNFETFLTNTNLWCPLGHASHEKWITDLVCTLLEVFSDKCYLKKLIPMCKVKVNFSEQLLPLLVYLIIKCGNSELISSQICHFFSVHWMYSTTDVISVNSIALNKLSLQCMLNAVHFVRSRQNMESAREFNNFKLNYLHVAQAAQFCTAHFTALLYTEIWCQEKIRQNRAILNNSAIVISGSCLDLIIQNEDSDTRKNLQYILRECYQKVGEVDALSTCELISLSDSEFEIEHYEQLQKWDQVVLHCDIKITQGELHYLPKLQEALKKCNLFDTSFRLERQGNPQFDCAWRLNQWDINDTVLRGHNSYDKYRYFLLKAIHDNDKCNFHHFAAEARQCVIDSLQHASLESSENLYHLLTQLQCLRELEQYMVAKAEGTLKGLIEKWTIQDEINPNDFKYIEPIHSQRGIILFNLISSECKDVIDHLIHMQLKFASMARNVGSNNTATRVVSNLFNISGLTPELQASVKFEKAQLQWLDDKKIACHILRRLLIKLPPSRLRAAGLRLYGTWMIETCSENPHSIIKNYFIESLKILDQLNKTDVDNKHIYEIYHALACFADSQYQQIKSYVKSAVFEQKVKNMEKSRSSAVGIKSQRNRKITNDEHRAIIIRDRQSAIDETEINNTYEEQKMYLSLTMEYYLLNLERSDENNVCMFRILSLLLENRSDKQLENLFNTSIMKVSSYKFIPILPQLIPHITNNVGDAFANNITTIVERCAKDHPHHTLPFILSLSNSQKDRDFCQSKTNTNSNEQRIVAAQKLLRSLENTDLNLKFIIEKMEMVSKALIHLAYVDQDQCKVNENKDFIIPSKCPITKIRSLENILLPTHILSVQKNCDYSAIVGIHSFSKTFSNVGGLNAPKKIYCIGTDGVKRNQLVKGKDDLRQDAVMQQVFNIMNGLLACNKQTMDLFIRTYKIVPLSQRSGILEWVDNSMPIGEYLVGDGKKTQGAHVIYNAGDISPARCRLQFKNAAKLSPNEKLKAYNRICENFHPVFHKFFEDSFVQPAVWYERRRAYTYSVATTSMCGYILGLGDRHVSNILIDKTTAEVVHIDFGIAFEQGLVLPTPETVPFRLTRDIEAGMGICGIEGVFRKSCERTLEMLRNNSETIVSILEVLLYDPLYTWTITPAEAYNRQLNEDQEQNYCGDSCNNSLQFINEESVNITAERTLLRLRQKLQGIAEGGNHTSVEGQVQKLLHQARDPSNLCRLFHGWQPYL